MFIVLPQPSTSSCSCISACLRYGYRQVSKDMKGLIIEVIQPYLFLSWKPSFLFSPQLLPVLQLSSSANKSTSLFKSLPGRSKLCEIYCALNHKITYYISHAPRWHQWLQFQSSQSKNTLTPFYERGQKCPEKSWVAKNCTLFSKSQLKARTKYPLPLFTNKC